MQITITHLTRMRGDRICVAGLTAEGEHVRPVPRAGHLTRGDAAMDFHLGAVIELANPSPRRDALMPEDMWFDLDDTYARRDASPEEIIGLLDAVAVGSLTEVFSDLAATKRGALHVMPGSRDQSLAVIRVVGTRSIFPDSYAFERLRFRYVDPGLVPFSLPVTDLRCYPDSDDWDIDALMAVLDTVPGNRPVLACVGLSRPFQPEGFPHEAQWVQLNTLWPGRR